jgi:hypothetical protein
MVFKYLLIVILDFRYTTEKIICEKERQKNNKKQSALFD